MDSTTTRYFTVREAFQRQTAQIRYDEFRRPSFWQVDLNFAKTTPLTDRVRFQIRLEAFNIFNSPMCTRQYNQTTSSADFGRINRKLDESVQCPAFHPAGIPPDVLITALLAQGEVQGGQDWRRQPPHWC